MNDEKMKTILTTLVSDIEDLAASQAMLLATFRATSESRIYDSDVESVIASSKLANAHRFSALRAAVAEL